MPFEVRRTSTFLRWFDKTLCGYKNSIGATNKTIDSLAENPNQGDSVPGFQQHSARKMRMALKAYSIGKSKGLRLWYLVSDEKQCVIPVYIHKKGEPQKETDVVDNFKSALRGVLSDLVAGSVNQSPPPLNGNP
jgi:hypothetical protein